MKYDAWQEYRKNLSVGAGDKVVLYFERKGYWKGTLASVDRRSVVVGGVPFHHNCIKEICPDENVEEPEDNSISGMARKLLAVEGWE